jgi:cell division protease FtsH
MPLSEHLVGRLMQSIEMDLAEALDEIRRFEAERERAAGAP